MVDQPFTHPDQVVASVGLELRVSPSGRRTGHVGLSQPGDAALRRLLSRAAMAAPTCTHDRAFADRSAHALAKGLPTPAALNAGARELAKLAWSIVAHGSAADPRRVDTQPPSKKTLDSQP